MNSTPPPGWTPPPQHPWWSDTTPPPQQPSPGGWPPPGYYQPPPAPSNASISTLKNMAVGVGTTLLGAACLTAFNFYNEAQIAHHRADALEAQYNQYVEKSELKLERYQAELEVAEDQIRSLNFQITAMRDRDYQTQTPTGSPGPAPRDHTP